jgi:AraC-like DNA-binding protein
MPGISLELNSVCTSGHKGATRMYWSVNEDLHLIHVLKGSLHLRWEGERHLVKQERVIYIPPLTEYGIAALAEGLDMLNFHFLFKIAPQAPFEDRYRFPLVFSVPDFSDVHRRLVRMRDAWSEGSLAGFTRATALACGLVAGYLKGQDLIEIKPGGDPEMAGLRQALADDRSSWFDADQWAESVSLSVSQMNRRFQAAFGATPRKFWQICRLNRVRNLLARSNLSMSVISKRCGIEDPNYFSRWFKAEAGVSPTECRRGAARI